MAAPIFDVSAEDSEKQTSPALEDTNLITWGSDDTENPHTWSVKRKWVMTILLNFIPLVVNMGTSILSRSTKALEEEYNVSAEVTILTVTLYLLGFTFGPLIFGPLSERIGRKVPIIIGVTAYATFCLPIALAQNFYTILICRFFSGLFGSASIAVIGGAVVDVWPDPTMRGVGLDIFIATGYVGPMLAPIVGSFVTQSYLGWRWVMWISAITGYSSILLYFFVVPETYGPVLLTQKAQKMRLGTRNWALHSKLEESDTDLGSFAKAYLLRPWILLVTEPIYLVVTIYMAFVYGLVFLFFEGFPIAFVEIRGWEPQMGSLPFLGLMIGQILATGFTIYCALSGFTRKLQSTSSAIAPESRLPLMIVGAVILPPGMFWAAWTSQPSIPWPAQVAAYILVGGGVFIIFVQGFKYIVDVYANVANSAISGNTFARSFFGAAFPLFAPAMYHNLGVPWATTLLAFISVALAPVPVIFLIYGAKIRSYSKNALASA
ncbi:MFS general substrate transporter [Hypoxylon trugodes]|uniref:MFS general substrate transporter n=1 Tax=Hypoxylon trugodes TaxID=326681 RepID=UPI00219C7145|nr:MFS general substrate transporter [Hypoxylon trugodes]KAI1387974.1 MFS general substrate transporter [Hypoxylon trugodes]